ncbi:hypothetical protein [Membranihabitans maritimus]|uniref:hypothetical protein n=1 Tax=Membranihabitans maritimus TaxID=2904244 RepID=UPI001F1BA916|nr:hypothetical protein [Membranihabitans maritimus]
MSLRFCIPSICIIFFTVNLLKAQSYQWAAGIKLSKNMGISAVYSPEVPYSIEAVISKNFWTNESGLSIIGRYHRKIITKSINIFGGGGLHHGFYNDERASFTGVLVNGGMEISLGKTNVAFNLSPVLAFGREDVKFRVGSDLSVRYILKKQPKKKGEFWEKIGFKKKNKSKKNNAQGDFWDFNWLKKK